MNLIVSWIWQYDDSRGCCQIGHLNLIVDTSRFQRLVDILFYLKTWKKNCDFDSFHLFNSQSANSILDLIFYCQEWFTYIIIDMFNCFTQQYPVSCLCKLLLYRQASLVGSELGYKWSIQWQLHHRLLLLCYIKTFITFSAATLNHPMGQPAGVMCHHMVWAPWPQAAFLILPANTHTHTVRISSN